MAEIITAKGTGFYIEKVIRGARERIVLISPYLKVQKLYLDELKSAARKGIPISILFREDEAKQEQLDALLAIENIKLFCLPELHAKCYFNEHRFVLTSMNLHDHSERNNKELGIMLEQEKDTDLFKSAWENALRILENADPLSLANPKQQVPRANAQLLKTGNKTKHVGYCIRTGLAIQFNLEKPFCYDAFKAWAQYGNAEYPEKYCHLTGESSDGETCASKPVLKKNWGRVKDVLDN